MLDSVRNLEVLGRGLNGNHVKTTTAATATRPTTRTRPRPNTNNDTNTDNHEITTLG